MCNVRTPTHIVTGADDNRVPASQSYILERVLYYLNVPSQLLVFPNEGHSLDKNPWHSKIKVREELKWLNRYGQTPITQSKSELKGKTCRAIFDSNQ